MLSRFPRDHDIRHVFIADRQLGFADVLADVNALFRKLGSSPAARARNPREISIRG